jgi:hypothetical protein
MLKPFWMLWILGTIAPYILNVLPAEYSVGPITMLMFGVFNPIGSVLLILTGTIATSALGFVFSNAWIAMFSILTIGQIFTTIAYVWVLKKFKLM